MRKPEFIYVSYIETTPEKLWEALTNSEFTKRYWFDTEVRSDNTENGVHPRIREDR